MTARNMYKRYRQHVFGWAMLLGSVSTRIVFVVSVFCLDIHYYSFFRLITKKQRKRFPLSFLFLVCMSLGICFFF